MGESVGTPLALSFRGAGMGLLRLDHMGAEEQCVSWVGHWGPCSPACWQPEREDRFGRGGREVEEERLCVSCASDPGLPTRWGPA